LRHRTALDKFLCFKKKKSKFFKKTLKRILEISKIKYAGPSLNWQSMFMQNFNFLAVTQTDLDKFLTFFQEKFQIFLKKISKFSNSEKRASQETSSTKFEPPSLFTKLKIFFLAHEISKFKNSEYEVHQSSPNDEETIRFVAGKAKICVIKVRSSPCSGKVNFKWSHSGGNFCRPR
jgi:hypothetical protein